MQIIFDNRACQVLPETVEEGLAFQHLYRYFSFKDPNAFWIKKRMGKAAHYYDGEIHYMSKKNTCMVGFLPYVLKFFDTEFAGMPYELIDNRTGKLQPSNYITMTYGDLTLAEHQAEGVAKVRNRRLVGETYNFDFPRGVIDAAVNSGKTLMMAATIDAFEGAKAMIVVESQELCRDHAETFSKYFDTAVVAGAKKFNPNATVTIAMIQTLNAMIKKGIDLPDHNMLLVDECHHAGADSYAKLCIISEAYVRVGFSGTPFYNEITKNMNIVGVLSDSIHKVTNQEMIALNVSRQPTVTMHLVPDKVFKLGLAPIGYNQFVDQRIHKSQERLNIIRKLILDNPEDSILITFDERVHGQFMYDGLKDIPEVEWVHGKDPSRIYKVANFKNGNTRVLISSTILKEGKNVEIDRLINAEVSKSHKGTDQWTGRAVRRKKGSSDVAVDDFYDNVQYLDVHSRKRMKAYKESGCILKYDYESNKNGIPKRSKSN